MERQFYVLAADGITPAPCDYATWLAWVESGASRTILETQLPGERIVTEFPGFELTGDGLFQTRVFGLQAGGMVARYDTFWGAIVGHVRMVEQVRQCLAKREDD